MATGIAQGMGVGVLPIHATLPALLDGRLQRVLPEYRIRQVDVYALMPSTCFLDAKVRSWINHLKSHFANAAKEAAGYELSRRRYSPQAACSAA